MHCGQRRHPQNGSPVRRFSRLTIVPLHVGHVGIRADAAARAPSRGGGVDALASSCSMNWRAPVSSTRRLANHGDDHMYAKFEVD